MGSARISSTIGKRPGWAALGGYLVLAAIVAWWAWRGFHDSATRDTGLAYDAGAFAWVNGHPELAPTWDGMPFLVVVFAFAGRVLSIGTATHLVTALNVVLVLAVAGFFLHRVRDRLHGLWWWVAAFGLLSYAPLMSTVWWKQFNIIALTLALGGFELARRGRTSWAALAIGLSVSIKPLAFLLPLVLLARRDTRRLGATSIAWIVGLDVAAQAFLGLRAHDLGQANPLLGLQNIINRTSSAGNIFLCVPLNFSPTSLSCRLNGGFQHWTLQHIIVIGLVALLGVWVIGALRGIRALGWEVLAFACALSVMLSGLSWPHYQIMLAPLFLLLLVRFVSEGAAPGPWAGLVVAFVLASIMWQPYGTLVSQLQGVSESAFKTDFLEQYAQFAQYVLVMTGVLWYLQRPRRTGPIVTASAEESEPVLVR